MRIDGDKTLSKFWSKVRKTDSCWLWEGYRTIKLSSNRTTTPANLAYLLLIGPTGKGKIQVRHTCGVLMCVNPAHLYLHGTPVQVECYACSKAFDKIPSEIKKSKSGKHFCSKSCATSVNNLGIKRFDGFPWEVLGRSSVRKKWISKGNSMVCVSCGFDGSDKPWCIQLDHVIPVSEGGSNCNTNLQPLCLNCHMDKTVNEKKGRMAERPKAQVC